VQATIPLLSRTALHRCFQRQGVSRLPLSEDGQSRPKRNSKIIPLAILTLISPRCSPIGQKYLFVVIDRTSKETFAELHPRAKRVVAV
jgi:hypothetical protein